MILGCCPARWTRPSSVVGLSMQPCLLLPLKLRAHSMIPLSSTGRHHRTLLETPVEGSNMFALRVRHECIINDQVLNQWRRLRKSWQQSAERHYSLIAMASSSQENPPSTEDRRWQRSSTKFDSKGSSRRYGTQGKTSSKEEDRIYYLGRLLTGILRHRAQDWNLKIRPDGYVSVNDLLKLGAKTMAGIPLSVYTVDDVIKAVGQDSKQRLGLLKENDVLMIRANQGHSIKAVETEQLLRPILSADEIPVCVHGTSMNNLDSILRTGLQKMGRNHVHFATGLPNEDGVISGMRSRSDALIYLDAKRALEDGMKLYMSDNGVVLTEGFDGVIPPKYFAKVAKWKKGKAISIDI